MNMGLVFAFRQPAMTETPERFRRAGGSVAITDDSRDTNHPYYPGLYDSDFSASEHNWQVDLRRGTQ